MVAPKPLIVNAKVLGASDSACRLFRRGWTTIGPGHQIVFRDSASALITNAAICILRNILGGA